MFASVALGARVDGAEARLTESVVRAVIASEPMSRAFVETTAGGVAAYAGPSSPMSKMIGMGFDGVPSSEWLADVEERFVERRAPLQAEVSTLADPAVVALLGARGYVLRGFENVSGRAIDPADRDVPDDDVRVEEMTNDSAEEWIDTAITAFQHPDAEGVPADELPARDVLEAALRPWTKAGGFRRYWATLEGRRAGVATLRIDAGVAQLCGAATLPAFRRRGVQGALLKRRLADGARAGCDLAVVTTQPGSSSQHNVQRRGFALLYARAILVKER